MKRYSLPMDRFDYNLEIMQAKGMVEEVYSQKNKSNPYHHMRICHLIGQKWQHPLNFGKLMQKISSLASGKQASK